MGLGLVHKRINTRNGGRPPTRHKTAKQLERHLKGVANHWRIAILFLIGKEKGINVEGIASRLNGNFKTISEHTRKLVQAGLVQKKYKGTNVLHFLSPYGEKFVKFLKEFQYSAEYQNI